jgi:bile acid:Na+ symporter, BASS family
MQDNPFIEVGLPIALFIIMTGIGLTLTTADFRREARAPKGMVVGSLAQLLVMPALGFGVVALLGLPPAIAVGVVVCAACPGGTTSNLVAYLARANVALSIVLTVIASVATILTLPLFVNLAIRWQPGAIDADVAVPLGRTVALLVGIVLVPVAIGMTVRRRAPHRADALEQHVARFGAVVLVALIIAIAWSVREDIVDFLVASGPAVILLNVAGLAVGFALAAAVGLPVGDRLTFAVELGIKNTTLGLLIALTIIRSTEVSIPAAVYGLLMYASGAAVVAYGRRRIPPAPATAAT